MMLRPPVIIGTGIISAAGCGVPEVWQSLRFGRTGLGLLSLFSASRFQNHLVGQVRSDVNELASEVRGSRSDKLAWIAAREALISAGLWPANNSLDGAGVHPQRIGVALGCSVGGMLGTEGFLIRRLREQKQRFGPLRFHECAGAVDLCADRLGAQGPCVTFSTACSAGAMAIAAAGDLIARNEADLMLAGGADSLSRLTLHGFGSLLLLDPNGCRPFDAGRAGISLGEGAGMLVLTTEEIALALGARILARLSGWGFSCDAHHSTAPHPEGRGAVAAIQSAFQRAGLSASEIDYVSAHGTGTPDNDAMEARALKTVFGENMPPVSSVKRFFGHTLAASGAIKAVLCVEALRAQSIPSNPGFVNPDPKLGLEPVKEFSQRQLAHLLSNSFGFGGNNVALVFSHADSSPGGKRRRTELGEVEHVNRFAIASASVVSPAGNSMSEICNAFVRGGAMPSLFDLPPGFSAPKTSVFACGDFAADKCIEPGKRRRLSRLQQMGLATAIRSLPAGGLCGTPPERICVALGTGLGSLNDTGTFVENVVLERAPRPLFFANSVHNSLASQIAIDLGTTGLNSTTVQREISFETALWHGAGELAGDRAELALVGAADELNSYAVATALRWRLANGPCQENESVPPGEGCAVFTLARTGTCSSPLAFVSSIRTGRAAKVNALTEARWIMETLARDNVPSNDIDLLLTNAGGVCSSNALFSEIGEALASLLGRKQLGVGAYKHCCGEHHSASAFGFFTAIGLVRGEIPVSSVIFKPGPNAMGGRPSICRSVILYTLSLSGAKGMCHICA